MRARTLILLMFAFIAAGGTYYLAQNWIASQRGNLNRVAKAEAPKLAPMVEVLVASVELTAGQFIKAKNLRWQAWPKKGMAETYFVKGAEPPKSRKNASDGTPPKNMIESFVGSVVRSRISPGEPITDGRVVRPGDRGFLAAVLQPDTRAVSVPINATTGISGFVFPGDRVDLLLTHSIQVGEDDAVRRATETVLTNIRVLAVDQRTDDAESKAELAKTATLEVTPKQAEIIAVASEMGRLSLSLRSLAQKEKTIEPVRKRRAYTWDSDASRLIPRKSKNAGPTVQVFRGTVGTAVSFDKAAGYGYRVSDSVALQGAATNTVASTSAPLKLISKKVN